MKLNTEQEKAVKQINGASLIISGAGTGKSTVLAAKIEAIQQYYGDEVPGILALSFTKRSTADLAARIVNTRGVSVMNITQFFYRVLRANGYGAFKVITDEYARQALVSLSIAAAGMNKKTDDMEVLTALETGRTDNPAVKKVIAQYYDFMKQKRVMDFSAIPVWTAELLRAITFRYMICTHFQGTLFSARNIQQAKLVPSECHSLLLPLCTYAEKVRFRGEARCQKLLAVSIQPLGLPIIPGLIFSDPLS